MKPVAYFIRTALVFMLPALMWGCTPETSSNSPATAKSYVPKKADSSLIQQARIRTTPEGDKVFEYLESPGPSEKWVAYGEIEILPAGTQLYHWGPAGDVAFWAQYGIQPLDIDNAVKTFDDHDVMGGGFYVSRDPLDSSYFGDRVLISAPKHDVVTLNAQSALYLARDEAIFINGRRLPVTLLAQAGIEAIRYSSEWMVVIRGEALENLYEGGFENYVEHDTKMQFKLFAQFLLKYQPRGTATDIEKTMQHYGNVGFWEDATFNYGPHKDPAAFIDTVRKRFSSDEIQSMLRSSPYVIYSILHGEGSGL